MSVLAGAAGATSATGGATGEWVPLSPEHPRPDPEHEARAAEAIARAARDIPFYRKRGDVVPARPAGGTGLAGVLAGLPLLLKRDLRATLPKQWAPAGCDVRAELASGALELVETSGST